MMHVKARLIAAVLVAFFAFSISALGMAKAAQSGTLTFKGWIDGSDYVYVQHGGATVWYQHLTHNLPGIENDVTGAADENNPTYVDGAAWYPTWSNSISDKYVNSGSHPTGEWNITSFTVVQARYQLTVVQYPSASNDYTAKIYLNDNPPERAAWYEFTLNWEAQGSATQSISLFSNPFVLGGIVVAIIAGVGGAVYFFVIAGGSAAAGSAGAAGGGAGVTEATYTGAEESSGGGGGDAGSVGGEGVGPSGSGSGDGDGESPSIDDLLKQAKDTVNRAQGQPSSGVDQDEVLQQEVNDLLNQAKQISPNDLKEGLAETRESEMYQQLSNLMSTEHQVQMSVLNPVEGSTSVQGQTSQQNSQEPPSQQTQGQPSSADQSSGDSGSDSGSSQSSGEAQSDSGTEQSSDEEGSSSSEDV